MKSKYKKIISLSTILVFHIIFQSIYLNDEIINWDMSTFLIAGQEVTRGNIPYVNQFEVKGPILFYLYGLIILIVGKNLILVKLVNDLIIYCIVLLLYLTVEKKSNNLRLSFFSGILFVSLMSSRGLGQSGYSEIYALFFIALSIYLYLATQIKLKLQLSGFFLSISSLISLGSVIFALPFLVITYLNEGIKKCWLIIFGYSIPHLFFLFLYLFLGKFKFYKFALFDLPTKYLSDSFIQHDIIHYVYQVSEEIEFFNLLMFLFLFIFLFIVIKDYFLLFLNICSIFIFFVSTFGAVHYLIFFAYTFCLSFYLIKNKFLINSLLTSLIFVVALGSSKLVINSLNNISNVSNIQENYAVYQFSQELNKDNLNQDFSVLALDYHLVLFYLDKPNASYFIHPTLIFNEQINSHLKYYLKLDSSFETVLTSRPNYIICNDILFKCALDGYQNKTYEANNRIFEYLELSN
tara:strand:- start:599 stop:1990 length:1392 start_codon:yes stop_codon:yes gene_type:complete